MISRPACALALRLAAVLLAAGVLSSGRPVQAGTDPAASPEQLKAAFVMNFLKFVEWPGPALPPPAAPLVIAVMGDDEFCATLALAAKRQPASTRPVAVRIASTLDEAGAAHLVFIGRAEERRLTGILRTLQDRPVLTVGDTQGFAEAGVVLNLYTFDQRVRIEVNTTAAARAQLRLSAHLLRIARIVG